MARAQRCGVIWAAGTGGVLGLAMGQCLTLSLPHVLGCGVLLALAGAAVWLLWCRSLGGPPELGRGEWLALCLPAVGLAVWTCFAVLTPLAAALFFGAAGAVWLLLSLRRGRPRWTAVVMGLLLCWFFAYCALSPLCLSPDSYSYYEMAQSLFTDFGRVSTVRQYVVFTDYGISFPYFYPLLLAAADGLSGLGMYSGVALNIPLSAGAALLLLPLSRRLCGRDWPGALAAVALLTNRKFLSEVLSGRAIPLAVLCAVVMLLLLCRPDWKDRRWLALAGLVGGVSMVTRFDSLMAVSFGGLCVLLLSGRGRWVNAVCYGGAAAVPLLPWAAYSLARFGTLWISDNSGTLTMVDIITPQRFFVPGEVPATLFTDPDAWLSALGGRFSGVLVLLALTFVSTQALVPLAALAAGAVKGAAARVPRQTGAVRWGALALILLFYALKTLGYCLVGYQTARYHAETVVLVLLAVCCLLSPWVSRRLAAAGTGLYLALALWAALVYSTPLGQTVKPLCTHPSYMSCISFGYQAQDESWSALWDRVSGAPLLTEETAHMPAWVAELEDLIGDPDARVFFISAGGDPYAYGAYTGQKTFASLSNMTGERFFYLIDHYIHPTHIVITDEHDLQWVEPLQQRYGLTLLGEVDGQQVFRVETTFTGR